MAQNSVDAVGEVAGKEMVKAVSAISDTVLDEYIKSGGTATIQAEYLSATTDITLDGMLQATSVGLGGQYTIPVIQDYVDYYLYSNYKTGTLSGRLNANATAAQKLVDKTVKEHLKSKTTWSRLASDLREKKISAKADLPKYLTDLADAAQAVNPDSKEIARLAKAANKRVEKLVSAGKGGTANLVNAYKKVIHSVEAGDAKGLAGKLDKALVQKSRYQSERVARNEISRAYWDGFNRRMADDPYIVGWRSVLSPAHPREDLCDPMAEILFPKNYGCPQNHHVGCICIGEPVYKDPFNDAEVLYDDSPARSWIDSQPDSVTDKLFRVSDRDNKKLENVIGYQQPINLHALPKTIASKQK